jgi:hypothetical protein
MNNIQPKKKKQTQNVLDIPKQDVVPVENKPTKPSLKSISKKLYGQEEGFTDVNEFGDEYVGFELDDRRNAKVYVDEDGQVYTEFYMDDNYSPLSELYQDEDSMYDALQDPSAYEDISYDENEPQEDEEYFEEKQTQKQKFEPDFVSPEEIMEGVSNEEVAEEEGLGTDNLDTLGLQLSELEAADFEVNLDSEGTGFVIKSPSGKEYDVTFDESGQLLFYDYFNQSYDIVEDINDIYQLILLNE